ncbi:MAG TPA: Na+/H+ antiporter [Solirubrobacterales bacterium]|nr:Na+/H+ antiporter [Solirubrobacterales bacterium]
MNELQIFIAALLVSVALLNSLANRLRVPFPIVLVIGGLLLALVPGIPTVELNPDLVLVVFLPPLLYSAAFFADQHALRRNMRVIALLAIGLVLATVAGVGVLGHDVFGLPWASAFTLGAILGPTDALAATAIVRRLGVPRRIATVLEGEALVNDATALVAYKIAVAAAVGEGFSASHAGLEFLYVAAGGIAIGLVVGHLLAEIRRRIDDPLTEATMSLFSGYAAFLPADQLGLSGVLATVACGLYLGYRAPELQSPQTRLQTHTLWEFLTFILNATLFVLIGLQLPVIVDGLSHTRFSAGQAVGYTLLASLTVVAIRFAWGFGSTTVIRALDRRPSQKLKRSTWEERVVNCWAGMRGAVSLAAALALPLATDSGSTFPGRDLILFVTFGVILFTLVVQGLSLPWLIRALGVRESGEEEHREELDARLAIAQAALERIDELADSEWTNDDTIGRVRGVYEFRRRRFKVQAGKSEDEDGIEERSLQYQRLMHRIYDAQRETLVGLRDDGEVSSEVMRRLERELDLEEARLEV